MVIVWTSGARAQAQSAYGLGGVWTYSALVGVTVLDAAAFRRTWAVPVRQTTWAVPTRRTTWTLPDRNTTWTVPDED